MNTSFFRRTIIILIWTLVPLFLNGCGGAGGTASLSAPPVAAAKTVTGTVRFNGTGLGQVRISITGDQTTSDFCDGSGNYTFHLDNGTYTVTPSRPGYSFVPASQTVTINNNGFVVDFTAGTYAISGRVLAGNNGGIAQAAVTVTDGSTGAVVGTATSDGSGSYVVNALGTGSYVVTVTHPNGYVFTPANSRVTLVEASVTADFTALNVATYTISGRVASAAGTGLANVALRLTGDGGSAVYSAVTDANGAYTIAGIADGFYSLAPTLAGYNFQPDPDLFRIDGADLAGQNITATPQNSGSGGVIINF